MAIMWTDVEDIIRLLQEAHPDVDPLRLRHRDLRRMVAALPGFEDDPQKASEEILEAIHSQWYEDEQERRRA